MLDDMLVFLSLLNHSILFSVLSLVLVPCLTSLSTFPKAPLPESGLFYAKAFSLLHGFSDHIFNFFWFLHYFSYIRRTSFMIPICIWENSLTLLKPFESDLVSHLLSLLESNSMLFSRQHAFITRAQGSIFNFRF